MLSTAFEPSRRHFEKYPGEDQNISPPPTWIGPSEGTKKIALMCDKPSAPRGEPFVRWVMHKIPVNLTGSLDGSAHGALEGENGANKTG